MLRRRLVAGESLDRAISASTWNDLLSLLDHRDANGLWMGSTQQQPASRMNRPGVVYVRNNTGSNLSQFSIVGIGGPAIDSNVVYGEFQREVILSAVTPDATHYGKFAVTIDAIPAGECGLACVSGVVQCRVDIGSSSHEFAELENGNSTTLKSGQAGSAAILWKLAASGDDTWCIVRIGNSPGLSPIQVRNDSGGARSKGETLEVTGVVSTPITNADEVLTGDLRDIEAPRGILLEDVADGAVGGFALHGMAYALIDIIDADHTHCYAKTGDANPQSNFGGPWRIVAKPTGTGNAQAALLLLGDACYERKVKTAATLSAGSSASCDFYVDGSVKGQETVYFNWMENGITSIASGKEGIARWFDDEEKWVMVAAEC